MKKGIKQGVLVTGSKWYMKRRIYGHVTCYLGGNWWAVLGGFGLESFHGSKLRPVKVRNK